MLQESRKTFTSNSKNRSRAHRSLLDLVKLSNMTTIRKQRNLQLSSISDSCCQQSQARRNWNQRWDPNLRKRRRRERRPSESMWILIRCPRKSSKRKIKIYQLSLSLKCSGMRLIITISRQRMKKDLVDNLRREECLVWGRMISKDPTAVEKTCN